MAQNGHFGPKWPKMAQNGPKWPKMAHFNLYLDVYMGPWGQYGQNGPKWPKMALFGPFGPSGPVSQTTAVSFGPKMSQNGLFWPILAYFGPKYGPKPPILTCIWTYIGPIPANMAQNGPKWPKMAQNGPFWPSGPVSQTTAVSFGPKMSQNRPFLAIFGHFWPFWAIWAPGAHIYVQIEVKIGQNGPKWPFWPKMAQNGPKWPKMAQNGPF